MSTEAKPFLKWAGGKGQLLGQLSEHLPNRISKEPFTYIEPFVGGGAMLGTDEKRFDFFIDTPTKKYLIEVNFYSGGGSKLNEVARAYTELAPKVNSVAGFEFVWITDGIGWKSARNKLEEVYNTIPSVYNLTSIGAFIERLRKC